MRDFVQLCDSQALSCGAEVWVEKTPQHLRYIGQIQKHVPQAVFVHLIRDGRDAAASLCRATREDPEGWGGERSVTYCVNRWLRDVQESLRYVGLHGHHFVFFDELVEAPSYVLGSLCEFLGLEYEEEMLTKRRQAAERLVFKREHWKRAALSDTIVARPLKTFYEVFRPEERVFTNQRLSGYGRCELKKALRRREGPLTAAGAQARERRRAR